MNDRGIPRLLNPMVFRAILSACVVSLSLGASAFGQQSISGPFFGSSNRVAPPSGSPPQAGSSNRFHSSSTFQPKTVNQAPFAQDRTPTIQWIEGQHLDRAMKIAMQLNKPLMLHFWNERCAPCMQLEKFVFPNPLLAQAINSQFVPVKVNTMKTPEIHKRFGVSSWPHDVFLAPGGAMLMNRKSPSNAAAYTAQVNSVFKIHQNFSRLASTSPQNGNLQTSPNPQPGGSRLLTNDNSLPGNPPPNPLGLAQPKSSTPQVESRANQQRTVENRYVQQPGVETANSTRTGNVGTENPQLPPLGLEGYCPVTLLREIRKVPGSREWGCIHRGKLYFFTNQSYREIFLKNPDRYAPVLAGYDVVIFRDSGQLVEGKSIYGGFVGEGENRLVFLFSSLENKQKFIGDKSGRYLEAARLATRNRAENWLR